MKNEIYIILAILSIILVVISTVYNLISTRTSRFLRYYDRMPLEMQQLIGIRFYEILYDRNTTTVFYKLLDSDYFIKVVNQRFRNKYFLVSGEFLTDPIYAMDYISLNFTIRKTLYHQYQDVKKGSMSPLPNQQQQAILQTINKNYRRFVKNRSFFYQNKP